MRLATVVLLLCVSFPAFALGGEGYVLGFLMLGGIGIVLPLIGIAALISLVKRNKQKLIALTFVAGVAADFWVASNVCTPQTPHYPCTDPPPSFWYVIVFFGGMFAAAVLAWLCTAVFNDEAGRH